jgi:serine/threonine protein kinase
MSLESDGELVGRRLGDYQLEGLLGRGGMAEVYRARELPLGRAVAVKVLPARLAQDHTYVARFRAEAQRVAALQHPHIVPVYFYSERDPLLYLVMPILTESLRDRLDREGPLDPLEAIRICQETASALEAAHEQGLIHRDVKPENILLDGAGSAMLTDFGIARAISQARQGKRETLSSTGLPVGTPEYMAPELLRNESADARMDIYALGAVLYELLTGRAPHEAGTPLEVAALALMTPISPPSRYRLAIWPALEEVIMTALAANPNARFQSVTAFAGALTRAGELAGADPTVTGTASSHVSAAQRFTQSKELPETPEAIPEASTVPVIAVVRPAGSARSPAAWWRAQSSWQRWFATAGAIALLAITLLSGVSLYVFGPPHPGPSTGASTGGIPAATVTAISAALATAIAQQTPGAAATATALATQAPGPTVAAWPTTPPQPTSTPRPTATTVPGAPLQINPMPLVLTPTQADPEICRATQRITNSATKVVGWAWQNSITQGSLQFQLNGQQVNSPPMDPGMASGSQDTLTITAECTAPSQSTAIAVTDTLGNPYTFELTVQ